MVTDPTTSRLRFDRGTILLEGADAGLHGLAGLLWDARVKALRAPASRYREVVAALGSRGVAVADDVAGLGERPREWLAIELRPYQEAAVDAWELAGRRGVVVLPTGSGKTHAALAIMARTRMRSLCLVPTRALVEQWLKQIERVYPHGIGIYSDGRHEVAPVTVATFEGAYRHMAEVGNRFELLIVDEAHHFGNGLRDEALEMSIAWARLGLTATPPAAGVATRLPELIGPRIFELTIGDLAGGYLASFDLVTLHLELNPSERAAYQQLQRTFRDVHMEFRRLVPDGSWADFVKMAARTEPGRAALSAWREARHILSYPESKKCAVERLLRRHRDQRLLVFTADNETAYAISRQHLVTPLTCDIGRRERDTVLDGFQRGHIRALVSARVLNEGIDVPDAEVAIVVGGSLGEREHVQRIGRLLRPRPGKRALIYELVCNGTAEIRQARERRRGLAARAAAQL